MTTSYETALNGWKRDGGHRPVARPDGIPTRIDQNWLSPAELAISSAMQAVEEAGGSVALTEAITMLSAAKALVADHVEGKS